MLLGEASMNRNQFDGNVVAEAREISSRVQSFMYLYRDSELL